MEDEPLCFFWQMNVTLADSPPEVRNADPSTRGSIPRRCYSWRSLATGASRAELRFIETRGPSGRSISTRPAPTSYPTRRSALLNALAAQQRAVRLHAGWQADDPAAGLLGPRQCDGDRARRGTGSTSTWRRRHSPSRPSARANGCSRWRTTKSVHLATFDRASPDDMRFRQLFGGKVTPTAEHPETLLYNYLTSPRNTAPRWYFEGSAVFMETWLGGGYGRAQGGYDEMMFRAMVRDEARFYDPLGTGLDRHRGRFPGRRKRLPVRHAVHELPGDRVWAGEAPRLVAARRGIAAFLLRRLPSACSASRSNQAWQNWIAWEHEFQTKNLAAVREHPVTPLSQRRAHVGLGRPVARRRQRRRPHAVRRRSLPRAASRTSSRSRSRTVPSPSSQEVKGAMQYRVASLALDPEAGTLFYTTDNLTLPQPDGVRPEDRQVEDAAQGPAHRRSGIQPGRPIALGAAHEQRLRHPRAHPLSRTRNGSRCTFSSTARSPSTWTSHPTARWYRPRMAGLDSSRAGAQVMQVRVMKTDSLLAGDATPLRTLEFGSSVPEGFVFSPGRQVPVRQLVLHRRIEHLSLRDRDRQDRGGEQRRDRVLPAGADLGRRAAWCSTTPRGASCRR